MTVPAPWPLPGHYNGTLIAEIARLETHADNLRTRTGNETSAQARRRWRREHAMVMGTARHARELVAMTPEPHDFPPSLTAPATARTA